MTQVLVDTSVWIDFLRSGDEQLSLLLTQCKICMHPMIVGELACGYLQQRKKLMKLWNNLPGVVACSHTEALHYLEQNHLMGRGIGYVDVHLLASVALSANTRLWTRDKRLHSIAVEQNLALI